MNCDEYFEKLEKDGLIPSHPASFTTLRELIKCAFVAGQQNGFPPAGTVYTPSANDENFDQDPR